MNIGPYEVPGAYSGDCRDLMRELPDESVQCVVTSPPYYGLRDYDTNGQLGLEATANEYVANMTGVFRELRRTLRNDGTLWLNIGDTYSRDGVGGGSGTLGGGRGSKLDGESHREAARASLRVNTMASGLPRKNLLGIPWRVAFALQADGWYLRADIIWHKPNVMPESVTDRPSRDHEYLFLMSKCPRYYYDNEAIKEPARGDHHRNIVGPVASHVPDVRPHTGLRAIGSRVDRYKERTAQRSLLALDAVTANVP